MSSESVRRAAADELLVAAGSWLDAVAVIDDGSVIAEERARLDAAVREEARRVLRTADGSGGLLGRQESQA